MEQSHKIKKKDKMSYFLNDPPYHPRKKCWAGYPPYGRSSPAHADTRRRGAAEENVPSVAAEQNLYSSTERWRESKAPPPVTSADLDLCVSKERVPMQIHSWTPATPPALPNLSFSLFFLNCCCFGSVDSTYFFPLFCVGVWILFPECKHFPPAGSPHVDTLLYESDVCLFFFPPVVMHFKNVSNNLFISFENINISKRQILLRNTNMNWLSCIILTAYKTNKITHIIIVIINSNSINRNSHLGQQW